MSDTGDKFSPELPGDHQFTVAELIDLVRQENNDPRNAKVLKSNGGSGVLDNVNLSADDDDHWTYSDDENSYMDIQPMAKVKVTTINTRKGNPKITSGPMKTPKETRMNATPKSRRKTAVIRPLNGNSLDIHSFASESTGASRVSHNHKIMIAKHGGPSKIHSAIPPPPPAKHAIPVPILYAKSLEILAGESGSSEADQMTDIPEADILNDSILHRKRNLNADPLSWKRKQEHAKRMKGDAYLGFKRGKKLSFGNPMPERKMGPRCRSNQCLKRKDIHCDDFSEEERTKIFDHFWKHLDWNKKKAYTLSLVASAPVRRRRKESSMRRQSTLIYSLRLNDERVQVCKKMFLSTLGIGEKQVVGWMKSLTNVTRLPRQGRITLKSDQVKYAEQFLDKMPKLPSHYCRGNTSKLYLETHVSCQAQLFNLYQRTCSENGLKACSRPTFFSVLKAKNIGIFSPRKDECDVCVGHRNGQVSENEYNLHCQRKDVARNAKQVDKSDAMEGKCHVLTMDLQAAKLSPVLNASSLYYKTKLVCHNFTVYNLKTHDAVCYWWNEAEGDLSASSFASCLVDFIKTYLQGTLPIIIYSDGCCAQNRNKVLANALLEMSMSTNRIITQKYLEKGHTQMECDSVHSVIEGALKNRDINVPEDYATISQLARLKQPYVVRELDYKFFKDFSGHNALRYSSIRPGSGVGDACVTNIKNIKYLPEGKIQVKLSYEETSWTNLPEKPRRMLNVTYPPLHKDRRKITSRKFQDLQDLKKVLPSNFHAFYDNLPHE